MMLFLQIIGGIVVGIIALIILGYAYFRIRYGKWVDYLANDTEPLQIHLNEDFSPDWREAPKVARYIEALKASGFEIGKAYNIVEMEGVNAQSMFMPPFRATIWTHSMVDPWVDISFDAEESGIEYDVSNAQLGETINKRPETNKTYMKGASISELLEVAREKAGDMKCTLVNESNYRETVEESYRKDMAWRCNQGGMTFEEFVATAKTDPKNYKEDHIREAYVEVKLTELHRWHEAAVERLDELESGFTQSLCESGKAVFMVPKDGEVEAFIRYIEQCGVIDEQQAEAMLKAFSGQSDLEMVVRRIFHGLSADLRPRKVRDIEFPISAELYEIQW